MNVTRRLAAVLLGVVVMVPTTMTRAQTPPGPHFTFTVPLQLSNLPPEIDSYSIGCSVFPSGGILLGTARTRGTISGGAVNTEVVVSVTANPVSDPALASEYSCSLHLDGARQSYMNDSVNRIPLAPGAMSRNLLN